MSTPRASTHSLFIRPDIRRKRITVECADSFAARFTIAGTDFSAETDGGACVVPFAEFVSWSPASPVLYRLVYASAESGSGEIAFGMREFTIKDGRFFLNTRPIVLQSLAMEEAAPEALMAARQAGFNGVQLAGSQLTPENLAEADRLGLLVSADLRGTEAPATVLTLRNHPSVVLWNVDANGGAVQKADPSRVVVETPSHGGVARCFVPYQREPQPIDLLTLAQPYPVSQQAEDYARSAVSQTHVSMFSALGAESKAEWGGADARDLICRSLAHQLDAVRLNPRSTGYCVTVTSGGDDTGPWLARTQGGLRPVVYIEKTNLVPRDSTGFAVSLINLERYEGEAAVSLQLIGPTNQVLWKKKRSLRIPKHGQTIWDGRISASGATGSHEFIVRIMIAGRPMIESRRALFVFDRTPRSTIETYVMEPAPKYAAPCEPFIHAGGVFSPVLIVPPLANSVRAYPDNEMAQVLGQASSGAVAIFFGPPDDWNDFAESIDPALRATSQKVLRPDALAVHENRLHPIFEGLPAGEVMGEPYRDLLPMRTFAEASDEEVSRCRWIPGGNEEAGTNVLVRGYGSGRVVFTHLRILDRLGFDPVADRLFSNLLRHFSRRAVPSRGTLPVHTQSVEWLRRERVEHMRKWKVIGMFPHDHAAVYGPEESRDFSAVYPGAYRPAGWTEWHTHSAQRHRIDFAAALEEGANVRYESPGTAYAYAEFSVELRTQVRLRVTTPHACTVWLNERRIMEEAGETDVLLRQGRNALLLKVSSEGFGCAAEVAIEVDGEPAAVRWWR